MHTSSPRALSALAYEHGRDYDPALPPSPALLADLDLVARACPIVADVGPFERARRQARERHRAVAAIPDWFSAEDLIAAPWERLVHGEPV